MILSATAGQTQQPPTPPLVKQINNGNWLEPKEAEQLRDELFYQRAVHAYMTMLPALNTIGMRDGSEKVFGKGYNVLPIWKDRMDSRTWVPTPNADVIYSMSYVGEIPQGYFAFKSPTYNVFLFFRTIMTKGDNGPDPKPAVAAAEQTRVYPLWATERDVKPMQFPNGSGKRIDMMYPVDSTYW